VERDLEFADGVVDEPETVLFGVLAAVAGLPDVGLPEVEVREVVVLPGRDVVARELAAPAYAEVDEVSASSGFGSSQWRNRTVSSVANFQTCEGVRPSASCWSSLVHSSS
jgi:hypothetical protein